MKGTKKMSGWKKGLLALIIATTIQPTILAGESALPFKSRIVEWSEPSSNVEDVRCGGMDKCSVIWAIMLVDEIKKAIAQKK